MGIRVYKSRYAKQINMASQLSTLTFVNTLTWRATNIEFSDVGRSGATDSNTKASSTKFYDIQCYNGINGYQPLTRHNISVYSVYHLQKVNATLPMR